jgi:hypothetical protein
MQLTLIEKLKKGHHLGYLLVDFAMLGLISLNLALIIFDWLFGYYLLQRLLEQQVPAFYHFYTSVIHANFIAIDLFFVGIYLTEFLIRWAIAVRYKTYDSWILYPIVHWYDLLGCIPLGSFRFLRILRVFSILHRLERLGITNISNSGLARVFKKYYKILVEEISDRVVSNVIDGIKHEIKTGGKVTDKIILDIIAPHKQEILRWATAKVSMATAKTYDMHQAAIKAYVNDLIERAIAKNNEIQTVQLVPVLGSMITSTLEKAISDIVYQVVHEAVYDIALQKNELVNEIAELVFETLLHGSQDPVLNEVALQITLDSLDVIRDKVNEKQWKLDLKGQ